MEHTGYIDLQVNGYGGVDFNDPAVRPEQIHAAVRHLRKDGTEKILATVITAAPDMMAACLRNLVHAREVDALTKETIAGFHIEGPFISREPGYPGAHPLASVHQADCELTSRLLEAGGGLVRLLTLAPESDPGGTVTRFISEQGVRVAAGHTNASLAELRGCIDQGLTLFTHLGNGCPMHMHRHDNIIQRALSLHRHLHYGLIADGVHLPLFMLRNMIELAGIERCFIVTDAMAAAGLGPGRYTLGCQTVEVDETQVAWSEDRSHFVGSAATMRRCAETLKIAGFSQDEISALTIHQPTRLIESHQFNQIADLKILPTHQDGRIIPICHNTAGKV